MNNSIAKTRRNTYSPLVILLGAFVILSLIYAWATPPLEASDELWHFGMINTIADTGQLPVQHPGIKTAYEQEGSQPPLYYLVVALLVKGIDRSDFDTVRQANPHAVAGIPGNAGNKNLVLHDSAHPALERTVLAVYAARLLSILCGCITVFSVYMAARQLVFDQPLLPILAAGLTAFNPMFLFITSSVNNDNLVTAFNSLIIWQMIMLFKKSTFSMRRSVLLAVLVALASLSKLSGLVMLPFALMGGFWIFIRPMIEARMKGQSTAQPLDWRGFVTYVLAVCVGWVVIAGWWYLRNITLYHELFGTTTMVAVAGPRIGSFGLQTLVDEFQGFRFAYWALFGAVNIMTYRWFYDVMDIVSVVILLGLLTAVVVGVHAWLQANISDDRTYRRLNNAVIFLWLVLIIATGTISVIVWTAQTYASQGRLLFPFNAAISILASVGFISFGRLIPEKVGKPLAWLGYAALIAFVLFAMVVPFASIAPQYASPKPIEKIPDSARSIYARFGDVALIGYEVADQRYFPGDNVPITVYWQVLKPSTTDYSLYLHATLDDGTDIGKVDSYPGAGRLRTSIWRAGAIYADSYSVTLEPTSRAISRLRMQVGWWNYADKTLVDAVDQNGQMLASVMLDVGGFAPMHTQETAEKLMPIEPVAFGDTIELIGYQLVDTTLTLQWRSKASLSANDTVFVQALDSGNQVAGQGDAPPKLPTRYWQVGEQFVTRHVISAPTPMASGSYRIILGWYKPVDGARLSAAYPDNAYVLPVQLVVP